MSIKNYLHLSKNIKNWPAYFKRKADKGETTQYITRGMPLVFDVPANFYHVFKEIFLEDFYNLPYIIKQLPANPIIVDIGANVGYFSFLIASKIPDAKIFAYEPIASNITLFNKNMSLNPALQNRLFVQQKAVTGKPVDFVNIFFDDTETNTVVASIYKSFAKENKKAIQIDAISLGEIIEKNQIQSIDLLKLDCEGSEYPILYESDKSIFKIIKNMAIEVHDLDTNKNNNAALKEFLKNNGYQITEKTGENECPSIFASKNKQ